LRSNIRYGRLLWTYGEPQLHELETRLADPWRERAPPGGRVVALMLVVVCFGLLTDMHTKCTDREMCSKTQGQKYAFQNSKYELTA
jgi:hypothetical protein